MSLTIIKHLCTQAAANFTTITWPSGPQTLRDALGRLVELAKVRDDEVASEGETSCHTRALWRREWNLAMEASQDVCWWPADGGYTAQRRRTQWRALGQAVEALTVETPVTEVADCYADADGLVQEEREYVEERASLAKEYGLEAIAHLEHGEWDDAKRAAKRACDIESEFGDCPAWEEFRFTVEAYCDEQPEPEPELELEEEDDPPCGDDAPYDPEVGDRAADRAEEAWHTKMDRRYQ